MTLDERLAAPVPWRLGDLYLLVAFNLLGVVLILTAWFRASDKVSLGPQVGWLDVAVAGVILAGIGNVMWLLSGRRCIGTLRQGINPALSSRIADRAAGRAPPEITAAPKLVATPAMTRYHRADCLLVAGKNVRVASRSRHQAAGRGACGVCRPDDQ